MIVLYLDIDGTIIQTGEKFWQSGRFEIAPGALDLLNFCAESFQTHWLSFHGRDGDGTDIFEVFEEAIGISPLPDEWLEVFWKITPAPWRRTKTDGIDICDNFYWVDDEPHPNDLALLKRHGLENRWIRAHLNRFPYDLLRIREILTEILRNS